LDKLTEEIAVCLSALLVGSHTNSSSSNRGKNNQAKQTSFEYQSVHFSSIDNSSKGVPKGRKLERRQVDNNINRPHRSLNNMTPENFAPSFQGQQTTEITNQELTLSVG
jgi:hypothetical protein